MTPSQAAHGTAQETPSPYTVTPSHSTYMPNDMITDLTMPGDCHFKMSWLTEAKYASWLKPDSTSSKKAYCVLCNKTFDITTMGRTAVDSHASGKKHKEIIQLSSKAGANMYSFVSKIPSKPSTVTQPTALQQQPSSAQCSRLPHVTGEETLVAETWWCLKAVSDNHSFSSNSNVNFIFKQMFPDSGIAASFAMGETKSMYLACFGIAPYLTSLLEKRVQENDYVLLFDESLNKELQKKQTDFLLRYWEQDRVQSRYYTSGFSGHGRVVDLKALMEEHIDRKIGFSTLIQLSMDGPNVNWALFQELQQCMEKEHEAKLLNIGSCGLHTLHNSFRKGSEKTGWGTGNFLKSLHRLFDDSPARREDFCKYAETSCLPLPFCATRWVENIRVAERAISVLAHLPKYISAVDQKKCPNPSNKSYDTVKAWVKDPLAVAKLSYFCFVASPVEEFLVKYQTDEPMIAYLSNDLETVFRTLGSRYLKKDVLSSAGNAYDLVQVDFKKTENCVTYNSIDIGFVASDELKKVKQKKVVSEWQLMEFKMECRDFVSELLKTFKEKSPLTHSLVRNLESLDPSYIVKNQDSCVRKFSRVLTSLVNVKRLDLKECDQVKEEYMHFIADSVTTFHFDTKLRTRDRLDDIYVNSIGQDRKYKNLWRVVKRLLLSHGQASVERSFSFNKDVSTANLSEHNLVSRRVIKDHLRSIGGLQCMIISQELLNSARAGRRRYMAYLDQKKEDAEKQRRSVKRKCEEEELRALKNRKTQLETDVTLLRKEADELCLKAENTKCIKDTRDLIVKSNSYRSTATVKSAKINKLETEIEQMEKLLKSQK